MGFEPTTFGTTIRRSNLLSYDRHFLSVQKYKKILTKSLFRTFYAIIFLSHYCSDSYIISSYHIQSYINHIIYLHTQ